MRLLFVFFFLLASATAFGQEVVDSVVSIRRSKFFTDLQKREAGISCLQGVGSDVYINFRSPFLKGLSVEYLVTPEGLVLHFGRSGKLYRMEDRGDSLLYFVRMDRTVNYNYNIGSYLFYSQGSIYELGGYGFWKSNGLLRKYTYVNKEWDIAPTSREVHVPLIGGNKYYAWTDTGGRFVYVPYQTIINDGLLATDNGILIDPVSYRLDVKRGVWEEMGVITENALNMFKSANWSCHPSERGLLLGFTKGIYYVDFLSNRISFVSDPSLMQTLLRMQDNSLSYFHNGWVYSFNASTYVYDSLQVDTKRFVPTGDVIWRKPFPYDVFAGIALFGLILGGLIFYRYRRNNRVVTSPLTVPLDSVHPFTETEQSLLQLLLNRSEKSLTANITDINYVLGVKDKSPGMQKKVRSDVMNNLNEKYAFVTRQKEPLVHSIRSESDKRYFEYFINPACLEAVRQLLK